MRIAFCLFAFDFLLIAVFLFFVGGSVLKKKKPIAFSSQWLFALMIAALLPSIIFNIKDFFSELGQTGRYISDILMPLLISLMYFVLLFFIRIQMQGYIFIGITDETLRNALLYGLRELGVPFEEVLTKIRLPDYNTEMNVSIQSWLGSGQIRIKDKNRRPFLSDLTSRMRDYFEKDNIPLKKLTAVFYVIIGVFMTLLVIGMFMLMNRL
jgi:hypothetical protein